MKTRFLTGILIALACIASAAFAAPPANDAFETPTAIAAFPGSATGSNVDATLQSGEPLPMQFQESAGQSIWFEWTPSANQDVQVDTFGSSFDTILTVWTGNSLGALTEVSTNDQYGGGSQSAVFFAAQAGTTYRIAVYGWGWDGTYESGAVTVNIGPDTASRITGFVYGPDGTTPLAGIMVSIGYHHHGGGGVPTAADGSYVLRGLEPGLHTVGFQDPTGTYAAEFYDNQPSMWTANQVSVPASTTVTGINASLALAGTIQGRVMDEAGMLLPNVGVSVYKWFEDGGSGYWGYVTGGTSTLTDIGGNPADPVNFRITGLSPATYRVGFDDYSGRHQDMFHLNAPNIGVATDIVVAAGAVVTLPPNTLPLSGGISGTVTGTGGAPLLGIEVNAYKEYFYTGGSYWGIALTAYTAPDGSYSLAGLDPGSYRVGFRDNSSAYFPEFYNDQAYIGTAQNITVTEGTMTTGIHAQLAPAGIVGGSVTSIASGLPLSGVSVALYRVSDGDAFPDYFATTDSTGQYRFGLLLPADYVVGFTDYTYAHLSEFHDGGSGTAVFLNALPVTVGPGATVIVDASLDAYPQVRGVVTGPTGTPLAGIFVALEVVGGYYSLDSANTLADGSYTLSGGAAGQQVRVRFQDPNGIYLPEYYDNRATDLEATVLTLPALNGALTGVNAMLDTACLISGTVFQQDGTTPLPGISVTLYRERIVEVGGVPIPYPEYAMSVISAANGSYAFNGLVPDTYLLSFEDYTLGTYIPEWHDNSPTFGPGTTRLILAPSETRPNVNASLVPYSLLGGTVSDAGGSPLPGITVRLYMEVGGIPELLAERSTDTGGSYGFAYLVAGNYRVEFFDPSGMYPTSYYNGASTLGGATVIALAEGASHANINGLLSSAPPVDPQLLAIRKTGASSYELDFIGTVGRSYQLRQSLNLQTWSDVGTPFVCAAGINVLTVSSTEPRIFWRVESVP